MTVFGAAGGVVKLLRRAGFEAFFVGGSVRDIALGTAPEELAEIDIATSATPEDILRVFRTTVPVGRAFGIVRVRSEGHWFEIASYRGPGGAPGTTLEVDAAHRDFTINAIFWDPNSGVFHDPVAGRADLEQRCVRAVGRAEERFREDPLRILRAIRFGSFMDFRLERGTAEAVGANAALLMDVSAERLREEFQKIATREAVRRGDAWFLLRESGVFCTVFPGVAVPEAPASTASVLDRLIPRTLPHFFAVALRNSLPSGSPPEAWRELSAMVLSRVRGSTGEVTVLGSLLSGRARYRSLPGPSRVRLRLAATRDDAVAHEDLLRAESDADPVLSALDRERVDSGSVREAPLIDGRVLLAAGHTAGRGIGWKLRRVRILQLKGRLRSREEALAYLARRAGMAPQG